MADTHEFRALLDREFMCSIAVSVILYITSAFISPLPIWNTRLHIRYPLNKSLHLLPITCILISKSPVGCQRPVQAGDESPDAWRYIIRIAPDMGELFRKRTP